MPRIRAHSATSACAVARERPASRFEMADVAVCHGDELDLGTRRCPQSGDAARLQLGVVRMRAEGDHSERLSLGRWPSHLTPSSYRSSSQEEQTTQSFHGGPRISGVDDSCERGWLAGQILPVIPADGGANPCRSTGCCGRLRSHEDTQILRNRWPRGCPRGCVRSMGNGCGRREAGRRRCAGARCGHVPGGADRQRLRRGLRSHDGRRQRRRAHGRRGNQCRDLVWFEAPTWQSASSSAA